MWGDDMEHDQDSFGSLPSGGAPAAPSADSRSLTAIAAPAAWQERQAKRMRAGIVTEWSGWYPCEHRSIDEARADAPDHIPFEWRPLYLAPTPLTDERIRALANDCYVQGPTALLELEPIWLARAIERAHGIGAASSGGAGTSAKCSEQPTQDVAEASEPNEQDLRAERDALLETQRKFGALMHKTMEERDSLLEAARDVLIFREGTQPIRGWLRDTNGSRDALTKLANAVLAASEGKAA
jgi:hypothetical protein